MGDHGETGLAEPVVYQVRVAAARHFIGPHDAAQEFLVEMPRLGNRPVELLAQRRRIMIEDIGPGLLGQHVDDDRFAVDACGGRLLIFTQAKIIAARLRQVRSEEHTSELQYLMRLSYSVFCLKKKTK